MICEVSHGKGNLPGRAKSVYSMGSPELREERPRPLAHVQCPGFPE